ncbi:MAG: class II fumarate hydratase [Deferrisomatales bacterium]|nr:class II fumarate hydratase [Deferrisomatales bacterium]
MGFRVEVDTLGEVQVPGEALWGAQTQRALGNGVGVGRLPLPLVRALVQVKRAAARVNACLGLIPQDIADAVVGAADEVLGGRWADQFPLSPFQTGSGTSTNMNVNEVLANRASELLGGRRGDKERVHPNDHVNRCQSSNDAFPTAVHLAMALELRERVEVAAKSLAALLEDKAAGFADVVKLGRTHLMDALPVTVGQEFGAYAHAVSRGARQLVVARKALCEMPLGGTAVGTGMNAHPEFAARVIAALAEDTGLPLVRAGNPFEALSTRAAALAASAACREVAVVLAKVANDLRWMASGPDGGLGELRLPALQPGSSIMPGKVNPVVPEAVLQAAAQVVANDLAVTQGALGGVLELNLMMPLIARNLLEQAELLDGACRLMAERCVAGIEVDRERCLALVERSLALVTPLARSLGYDVAARVAKEAQRRGVPLLQVATEMGVAPEAELRRLLDPTTMLGAAASDLG